MITEAGRPGMIRLAILSTPRSGNLWLRWLLREALALEELAVHAPRDIPATLPARVVLQMHWHRTAEFESFLDRHGFRVVVLARHPLDVLISILHFVRHEPATSRWLDGEGALTAIAGESPTSDGFLRWATGPGSAALLSVTPQWWDREGASGVRYEELVAAPAERLAALLRELDLAPARSLDTAITRSAIDQFRGWSNRHAWLGRSGLWRRLLPAVPAGRIAAAQRLPFAALGYVCDPDPELSVEAAGVEWASLAIPPGDGP